MAQEKKGNLWKGILFLVAGAFLVGVVAEVTRKLSQTGEVSTALTGYYTFLYAHVWQFFASLSLLLGIWFSLVRRRIYVSLVFMLISFACAFVLPFLNFHIF